MRSVLVAAAAIAFSARDARYSALAGGSSDDKEANTAKSQSFRRVRSCKNDDARDPLNVRGQLKRECLVRRGLPRLLPRHFG